MRPFAYTAPADVAAAVAAVAQRPDAAFLGGGTNLVDHLRLGLTAPGLLVDVTGLLPSDITDTDDTSDDTSGDGPGLRIGGGVRNAELAADRRVRERYPVLAQSLLAGASSQLRNMATTAGNPLQRTRCAYFRDVAQPCNKRRPGSGCSAIGGATREMAVLGASQHCVATHPSDMAVALTVLDAAVEVTGPAGDRSIPFGELHRLPGHHPERDTVLEHGELITAITLPGRAISRRSAYRKVRDRASYAFALVSVAVAVEVRDGVVRECRIAFGGLAHRPWRARAAEAALRGTRLSDDAVRAAARAELAHARPLDGFDGGNAFKVALAEQTLVATLRDLTRELT